MEQKELYNKIMKASNKIAKANRRGTGSYMICNSIVADAIFGINKRQLRKKKLERILNDN